MGKRTANQATLKSTKKAKTDPVLASIADCIMQAEDLPERCRTMIVESLPLSLGVPCDKRHEVQTAIVNMARQVLESNKATMEAAVASEEQQIETLHASRAGLSQAVEDAETALATHREKTHAARTLLADATDAVRSASQELEERHRGHKASLSKLEGARADKVALESAFDLHFKPLLQGDSVASHLKELEPHLKHLEIEASLFIAIPSSCAKPKEERGSFDSVVLSELEKALQSKIAFLGNTIAAEVPASGELEAAVLAAQEEHDAKKDTQKRAVSDFEAARKEEGETEAIVNKAKAAVTELQPSIDAASQRLANAKSSLETFQLGPFAQFETYSKLTSAVEVVTEIAAVALGA